MRIIVRARFRIEGFKGFLEGVALVDTGTSFTSLDRGIADEIGVKYLGKSVRVVTADGHEVEAELAIVSKIVVENEELPYAHLAVYEVSAQGK